jgi:uncharacterized damage-inducible protein DinB
MEPEVQGYLAEFSILRQQIRDAIQNLDDEAANWLPFLKGANSIYAILCHLAGSEDYWVQQIIGGKTVNRDREAEFRASGHLSEIVDRWEEIGRASQKILSKLNTSQLGETRTVTVQPSPGSATVRWCILHQISHFALHLGHIQLTRQLWEQK